VNHARARTGNRASEKQDLASSCAAKRAAEQNPWRHADGQQPKQDLRLYPLAKEKKRVNQGTAAKDAGSTPAGISKD